MNNYFFYLNSNIKHPRRSDLTSTNSYFSNMSLPYLEILKVWIDLSRNVARIAKFSTSNSFFEIKSSCQNLAV